MRGPPNLLPFINSCQTRMFGPPRRLDSGFLLSHIRVNERGGCICSRPVFVCRPVSVVEASPSGMICQPSHTHCQGSLVADRNPRPAAKDSRPLTVRCQEQRSLTAKYGQMKLFTGLYGSRATYLGSFVCKTVNDRQSLAEPQGKRSAGGISWRQPPVTA